MPTQTSGTALIPGPLWWRWVSGIDVAKNVSAGCRRIILVRPHHVVQLRFECEALVQWPPGIDRHPGYLNGDYRSVELSKKSQEAPGPHPRRSGIRHVPSVLGPLLHY